MPKRLHLRLVCVCILKKKRCSKARVLGRRVPNEQPQKRLRLSDFRRNMPAFKKSIAMISWDLAASLGLGLAFRSFACKECSVRDCIFKPTQCQTHNRLDSQMSAKGVWRHDAMTRVHVSETHAAGEIGAPQACQHLRIKLEQIECEDRIAHPPSEELSVSHQSEVLAEFLQEIGENAAKCRRTFSQVFIREFPGKMAATIFTKSPRDIFHSAPNKVLSLLQLWGAGGPKTFCESSEDVRLPRERAWHLGRSGYFLGGSGSFLVKSGKLSREPLDCYYNPQQEKFR